MARAQFPVLLVGCLVLEAIDYSSEDIGGDTCKQVVNPILPLEFCIKNLSSDPRSPIADCEPWSHWIEHLKKSFSWPNSYAAGLLKKKWDPYMTPCLKDCVEMYTDSVDSLFEIDGEYKEKLYGEA